MKTIADSSLSPDDLAKAVRVDRVGLNLTIYYAGDVLPLIAPTPAEQAAQLQSSYDAALTDHFNAVAAQRHYDSYLTAALRAGYAGPFQAEGIAYGSWMDSCNAQGYALISAVQAGTKPLPTIPDFIAGLPAMAWPTP